MHVASGTGSRECPVDSGKAALPLSAARGRARLGSELRLCIEARDLGGGEVPEP